MIRYDLRGLGRSEPPDDPAIVVGARFGVGWTPNFGNPVAWLMIAGTVAAWAGLAVIGAAAGI